MHYTQQKILCRFAKMAFFFVFVHMLFVDFPVIIVITELLFLCLTIIDSLQHILERINN